MTRSELKKRAWLVPWLCLGLVPGLISVVLLSAHNPARAEAHALLRDRSKDYVGASSCKGCHEDKFRSWHRTYHRSMTQLPSRETVLGAFDGTEVAAFGARATPFERDGHFYFKLPAAGGEPEREAEVALTVGSHRYQQYFERVEKGTEKLYKRLPLLWHVAERRWLHLNGAFLEQDNDNWSAHAAVWNYNCIFCHNTGVAPGVLRNEQDMPVEVDSHVADLGIACEACHGPGRAHATKNRSPLSRVREYLSAKPPADIVDPPSLGQRESLALCGQCHSQRLPDPPEKLWDFLQSGPTYRPGGDLAGHVSPVTRDTPVPDPSQPRAYSDRFWADGTARLSSYEYLGATQSPCLKDPKFTCTSCHAMHAGDSAGQLRPEKRGDQACAQCHGQISADIAAHTHHKPESSGSRCLDCHMPRMVYGILDVHRSHRIESPNVQRDVELGRPNACTTCHLDKSPLWAADAMRGFWGEKYARPRARPDGLALEAPEALSSLHAGDPVQRVVYAWHAGRADPALFPEAVRATLLANLTVGMVDPYGAMRFTARRSALRLDESLKLGLSEALSAFDVQAEPNQRNATLREILQKLAAKSHEKWGDAPPDLLVKPDYRLEYGLIGRLIDRQAAHQIETGE
jgi:predicted CXXCH cytochrome family protein